MINCLNTSSTKISNHSTYAIVTSGALAIISGIALSVLFGLTPASIPNPNLNAIVVLGVLGSLSIAIFAICIIHKFRNNNTEPLDENRADATQIIGGTIQEPIEEAPLFDDSVPIIPNTLSTVDDTTQIIGRTIRDQIIKSLPEVAQNEECLRDFFARGNHLRVCKNLENYQPYDYTQRERNLSRCGFTATAVLGFFHKVCTPLTEKYSNYSVKIMSEQSFDYENMLNLISEPINRLYRIRYSTNCPASISHSWVLIQTINPDGSLLYSKIESYIKKYDLATYMNEGNHNFITQDEVNSLLSDWHIITQTNERWSEEQHASFFRFTGVELNSLYKNNTLYNTENDMMCIEISID